MIVSSRVKELEQIVKNCHHNGFRAGVGDGKESHGYGLAVLQKIKSADAEKIGEFLDNYKAGVGENVQTKGENRVYENGQIVNKRILTELPCSCKACDANKICYTEVSCVAPDKNLSPTEHHTGYSLRKM